MYFLENIFRTHTFIYLSYFNPEWPRVPSPEQVKETKNKWWEGGEKPDPAKLREKARKLTYSLDGELDSTWLRVKALKWEALSYWDINSEKLATWNATEWLSMGEVVRDGGEWRQIEWTERLMWSEILAEWNITEILEWIKNTGDGLVINESTSREVLASFESEPFEIEWLTEAEITEEITRRTIAIKAEQTNSRVLFDGSDGGEAMTEWDFIRWLEEEFWIDQDALMALRVRNQAGIWAGIDETWVIENPEKYQEQMRELAQRAKLAQDFLNKPENKALLEAGNEDIYAQALAMISWQEYNDNTRRALVEQSRVDRSLWDGFSSVSRLWGQSIGWFENFGTPSGRVSFNPSQLKDLPPASLEKAADLWKMFWDAIDKYPNYWIPKEWATDPNLHKVVMKESWWIVWRLNYTFDAVAKRMGTKIDDPQFVSFIHQELKAWKRASDFW